MRKTGSKFSGHGLSAWLIDVLVALAVTATFTVSTGTIDGIHGYSQSIAYRLQSEALLRGDLAVADNPAELRWDWVWSDSGVHQPWGLGVPILRLPFEAAARLLGREGFPDRLVFMFYLFVAVLLFLRVLVPTARDGPRGAPDTGGRAFAALLGFLSPLLIVLLSTRFDVYEEAISYLIFASIVLAALLYRLARDPSLPWFLLACLVAGMLVAIRPTGVFYAIPSAFILLYLALRHRFDTGWILVGFVAFASMPIFVAVTNMFRFGSPFRFGPLEALTLAHELAYAMNFSYPYLGESLASAARELLGMLFELEHRLPETLEGVVPHMYRPDLHDWQSAVIRYREYYTPTYPFWVAFLVAPAWLIPLACIVRRRTGVQGRKRWLGPVAVVSLWSLCATSLLFAFYLWTPVISTRYMLDFLPAFSAASCITLLITAKVATRFIGRTGLRATIARHAAMTVLIAGAVFWTYATAREGIASRPRGYDYVQAVDLDSVTASLRQRSPAGPLPRVYRCGQVSGNYGIPMNLGGWNAERGQPENRACIVGQATILFFGVFDCLNLLVEDFPVRRGADVERFSPGATRVTTDAGPLRQVAIERLDGNRYRLRFCRSGPTLRQRPWNDVMIGWVEPERLTLGRAPVRLLAAGVERLTPARSPDTSNRQ